MSSAPPQMPSHRARHACDRCRVMRSKCSGGIRCTLCETSDAICVYSDRKREQEKSNATDTLSSYHEKDVDLYRIFDKSADRIKQLEAEKATLVEALTDVIHKSEISLEQCPKITKLLSWVSSPTSNPVK